METGVGDHLTFNFVFGQVDRGAVGEDVRDGADAPVHQRGGDWMHRHDCDLWLPPAPSSYRNDYREEPNFPPTGHRGNRGSKSMDGGGGEGGLRWHTVDSAACPPNSRFFFFFFFCWSQNEKQEQSTGLCVVCCLTSLQVCYLLGKQTN